MKRIIWVLLITPFFFACSHEEETSLTSETTEPIVLERLGLTISETKNGKFEMQYFNGDNFLIDEIIIDGEKHHIVTSSLFQDKTIGIIYNNDATECGKITYYDYDNMMMLSRSDFQFIINGSVKSPCSEHESAESFVDCFKREIDEFCDSIVSCVFLAANAKIVATVVAIHCVYCGNQQ